MSWNVPTDQTKRIAAVSRCDRSDYLRNLVTRCWRKKETAITMHISSPGRSLPKLGLPLERVEVSDIVERITLGVGCGATVGGEEHRNCNERQSRHRGWSPEASRAIECEC